MRMLRVGYLVMITLILVTHLLAQGTVASVAGGVREERLPEGQESLVIGSGDTIRITVFEAPDLEQRLMVSDAGIVRLTLGGEISAKGHTPVEVARQIEDRLVQGRFILNPHVSVQVERYATQSVTIFGQVKSPGAFTIDTNRTLIEVLALAGGLTDLADHNITIMRRGTGEKSKFFVRNDPSALLEQPLIHPGDTVFVSKVELVYFLGDVNRPGGYPESTNGGQLTVLQALALAGSTPPTAVPSHATLVRKGVDGSYICMNVNLSAMQKGKAKDIALQADDIVFVPYSYLKNVAVNITSLVSAASAAAVYQF